MGAAIRGGMAEPQSITRSEHEQLRRASIPPKAVSAHGGALDKHDTNLVDKHDKKAAPDPSGRFLTALVAQREGRWRDALDDPVSYTHLTLPTILLV